MANTSGLGLYIQLYHSHHCYNQNAHSLQGMQSTQIQLEEVHRAAF